MFRNWEQRADHLWKHSSHQFQVHQFGTAAPETFLHRLDLNPQLLMFTLLHEYLAQTEQVRVLQMRVQELGVP